MTGIPNERVVKKDRGIMRVRPAQACPTSIGYHASHGLGGGPLQPTQKGWREVPKVKWRGKKCKVGGAGAGMMDMGQASGNGGFPDVGGKEGL